MSALQELREALEHAGLKEGSAERIAYALQSRDFVRENTATKEDIHNLKEEIHHLENKMEKEFFSVKTEMASIKNDLSSEIKELKNDLSSQIKELKTDFGWMKATGGAILISVFAQILMTVFAR